MWNDFLIALSIMGKGMSGIFIVIGLITLGVILMGRIGSGKQESPSGDGHS